ncbi:hypothetical protein [Natranaerobius thermophilus]|uniref:Colicin V production protein n=1 Tax=Natranaerobius thermophilus (strain ATCC BAA-1301 / DSM 18059 / JW/NM-WN-LF) TaxID=457570 RepID=B2A459_NATTJ|nr:hypothetical protein [Natranaerobius thermophilus]ACB86465.1 hypothetical protein Nther_2919 [Natranaerobius thermophilus JW/NM-WN-LF]
MNIIDLVVMLGCAWYGIIGFARALSISIASVVGLFFSILLATFISRPSAKTIAQKVDYEVETVLGTEQINLDSLLELGIGENAIKSWYFINEEQQEMVPVQSLSTGEIEYVWEVPVDDFVIFFLANLVCFLIVYFVCQKLVGIILDAVSFRNRLKTKKLGRKPPKGNSWLGAALGIVHGCLVMGVWLFLLCLLIPFGGPYTLVSEVQNSYIGFTLLETITNFWN